jgi:hypothetical protein
MQGDLLRKVPRKEREDNICQRLEIKRPSDWTENAIVLFDYPIWKNPIPIAQDLAAEDPVEV